MTARKDQEGNKNGPLPRSPFFFLFPAAASLRNGWVLTLPGAAVVAGLSFLVIQFTGGSHHTLAIR